MQLHGGSLNVLGGRLLGCCFLVARWMLEFCGRLLRCSYEVSRWMLG